MREGAWLVVACLLALAVVIWAAWPSDPAAGPPAFTVEEVRALCRELDVAGSDSTDLVVLEACRRAAR